MEEGRVVLLYIYPCLNYSNTRFVLITLCILLMFFSQAVFCDLQVIICDASYLCLFPPILINMFRTLVPRR
jgi:hypothetical protein